MKRPQGFTIVELMVVIVIATILMAIAVPSYQNMIKRNNVQALQNRLASAIVTARSEAASRSGITTVCASRDGATCSGDWTSGWIVFLDNGDGNGTAGNSQRESDEVLILSFANTGDYQVEFADDQGVTAVTAISFNNQGFSVDEQRALATICEPAGDPRYARGLIVERSGRTSTTRDLEGEDGIHESRFDDGFGNVTVSNLQCQANGAS